ncbi:glycosyltransferase family 4 protein [Fibrella forsythiae]|uniref:Glycosyltransferase family 4 protein n=1 Tax=Fibrella forsythiae TaxID=2817061 RepID=A0ABS3JQX6_9BACT|nr:glycosyltransferase family 1 protein [Fibrella forsythiae]MBO0952413.1 glycosyltransferase family 4 protein [Fibrella forsythiae]
MKVLYDHQAFTGMTYGGVTRYFYELMQAYANRDDIDFELSLQFSNNEYLDKASFSSHRRYGLSHWRNVSRLASAVNRLYSNQRVRIGDYSVFHPTYYHNYFLRNLGNRPLVVTFHDATSERYGKQYPDVGEHLSAAKKIQLARADKIIAVSEFSKQEILRFFPVDEQKIEVIHLGTAFSRQRAHVPVVPGAHPYLLYVGKRGLYKNFDGFFQAIQPVLRQHSDLHLICAGGGVFTNSEKEMIQSSGFDRRVHYRSITDLSLYELYHQAEAFVFPSLNEGFGIPVLEAFSAGCPAILSNRSSLPEVGADAAVYFDPEQADSIASSVDKVLTDSLLRQNMRQKGAQRLTHFSWEKTAAKTQALYKQLS